MKDSCQKWKVKLIFRGASRLSWNRIVECLEIIDVWCNLKQFDGLTWLTWPPDFTTDLHQWLILKLTVQPMTTEQKRAQECLLGSRPKRRKSRLKAEVGGGFLGEGSKLTPHQLGGSWEGNSSLVRRVTSPKLSNADTLFLPVPPSLPYPPPSFPSLSPPCPPLPSLPSPPLEEGGPGVLPRKILKL